VVYDRLACWWLAGKEPGRDNRKYILTLNALSKMIRKFGQESSEESLPSAKMFRLIVKVRKGDKHMEKEMFECFRTCMRYDEIFACCSARFRTILRNARYSPEQYV